jgi:hypothetical protein
MDHARRIERAFTTQPDAFEGPDRNRVLPQTFGSAIAVKPA